MRRAMMCAAAAALALALGGGCKKSEPAKAPTPPTAKAEAPPAAAPEADEAAAPEAGEAPAADAGATAAADGAAKADAGCESAEKFDEVAIAAQKAAIARLEASKAVLAADEAEKKARELQVAAMHRYASTCAERSLDPGCVGAASGDPSRCQAEVGGDAACKVLALMRRAVTAKAPAMCAAIGDGGIRAVCTGAAGGELACPEGDAEEAVVCRAMRDGEAPECKPGDEACTTFWMVTALMKQDEVPCGRIPDPKPRSHCRAIATGDASLCAVRGEIPAACRDVVLESGVEQVAAPEGMRYVVRLRAINLYAQAARCRALLDLRVGEAVTHLEKDLGTLEPGADVRDYTWGLEGMARLPILAASTTCEWDPSRPGGE